MFSLLSLFAHLVSSEIWSYSGSSSSTKTFSISRKTKSTALNTTINFALVSSFVNDDKCSSQLLIVTLICFAPHLLQLNDNYLKCCEMWGFISLLNWFFAELLRVGKCDWGRLKAFRWSFQFMWNVIETKSRFTPPFMRLQRKDVLVVCNLW